MFKLYSYIQLRNLKIKNGPDTFLAGYRDIAVEKKCCHKSFNSITIRVGPYICISVQTSIVGHPVRPSICNMYELVLTYCYSAKNLRNYSFICLFKKIFLLNCRISSRIIFISGILPHIENGRVSGLTLKLFKTIYFIKLEI